MKNILRLQTALGCVLMTQAERVTDATAGWFKYTLNGDTTSRDLFVGASCGLCNRAADFEYGQRGLP